MKHILKKIALLAGFALFVSSLTAAPALVVNKGLEKEKIDAATVKAVFLGKKVSWDSAGRVAVAVLKGGPVAEAFCKASLDQDVSQFNNYWRRLAMTGGGIAPKSFETEAELKKFVAETPGAIGYLDEAQADASVLVVKP
jgi:ABC-type phosphate transport system substrate-binding protein